MRVICVGHGAIGAPIAATLMASDDFAVVAVVDPALAGQTVNGVPVHPALDDCPEGDVAVLATGSKVQQIAPQIEELLGRGLDVVSTSEELTFPWLRSPREAAVIDSTAKRAGRTVIGTGVNPGFLMDLLPVVLSGSVNGPKTVLVTRNADLAKRRAKLREKVGVGLDLATWRSTGGGERYGHVGLLESAYLVAIGIGGEPQEGSFDREPVCDGDTVIGVRELAEVSLPGGRRVQLELVFAVGNSDEDVVEIDGEPGLRMVIDGGLNGDGATVARVVHTAKVVSAMPPGLRLPLEIPAWAPRADA